MLGSNQVAVRAIVRADKRHAAILGDVELNRGRPLRQREHGARISRRRLSVRRGKILFEVVVQRGRQQVGRDDAEVAAEDPFRPEVVSQAQTRLPVVIPAGCQRARVVDDRAFEAGKRIGHVRIELGLFALRGLERRFIGPAQSQADREIPHRLVVVLKVERV